VKVTVLGAGPAGLMAAHAAVLEGCDVRIVSNPRKSRLYGAQYLHAPIPGMTDKPPVTVHYELWGHAEDYRRKVYGAGHRGSVSPEDLAETHQAWDIRQTYDALWSTYHGYVVPGDVGRLQLLDVVTANSDVVISTVPAPVLCRSVPAHTFHSQTVYAIGDAPDQQCPVRQAAPFSVICNGNREPSWYRNANVFGYTTCEWPMRAPYADIATVTKPLETNCDCWPTIIRMGRYGRWQKGILSHTAFTMTSRMLQLKQKG